MDIDILDSVDGGIDVAIEGAATGIEKVQQTISYSATVMKSHLKTLRMASDEFIQETIDGVNHFFKYLQKPHVHREDEESDDDDDSELNDSEVTPVKEDTTIDDIESSSTVDKPVTVDVTVDVTFAVREENAPPLESIETPTLPECLKRLLQSDEMLLEVSSIEDFSVSCKTKECRQCLLWFYLQTNKQQTELPVVPTESVGQQQITNVGEKVETVSEKEKTLTPKPSLNL